MYKYSIICILILLVSCSPKIYPPSEHINIRDSVAVSFRDSVIYHHQTVNKDYAGLLDSLRIQGEHSSMLAYADTTHFIIKGELKEEEIKQQFKEKIVYKEHRDTTYIEKPIPYEVEKIKEVVPKWCWWLLVFDVVLLLVFAAWIYIKISKVDSSSLLKKN